MEPDDSGVFSEGSRNRIPNTAQQLDGILESISPEPGPSNRSSQISNHNILRQVKEELVVKNNSKAEMESPHCDNFVKVEPGCNTLGHVKEEKFYNVPVTKALTLECFIKQEPGTFICSSYGGHISGQLREEVVKDIIKVEMESPRRESDQEGNDTPYTDVNVRHFGVKKKEGDIMNIEVKSELRSSTWLSNANDKLGYIKVENCDNVSYTTKPLDGSLQCHIKPEPGCSTWSSNHDQILGQQREEQVVEDTIKVKMKSRRRESDQEGNNTHYTDIDVKNEAKVGHNANTDIHQQTVDKQFACSTCSKCFSCQSSLKRHVRTHSGVNMLSCPECEKCFNCQSDLSRHMLTHSDIKPLSCSICGKSFHHDLNLKRHMLTHSREKLFSCTICGKSFNYKSFLTQHMLIHSAEKPFSCNVCNKVFNQKSHFKTHQLIHSGEKPFSCSVCNKCFREKSKLTQHMLTHARENPFSCSICRKSFSTKTHLTQHTFTHSGKKLFSCDICNKHYSVKFSLKTHMLTHFGKKPFSCSLCDKCFIKKSDLMRHTLAHTGEKPFSCTVCKKSYTEKSNLTRHFLTHSRNDSFSNSNLQKDFKYEIAFDTTHVD